MKKILIANWKANPIKLEEALNLYRAEAEAASKQENYEVVICPPFVFLEELSRQSVATDGRQSVRLGAQDVFWENSGPFTGEISPEMLGAFGVAYVLVGHSDRRYLLGEDDEMINRKIKAALAAGIKPVLLVGERSREDGREDTLIDQISRGLSGLTVGEISAVILAYEPVWAISSQKNNPTGKAAGVEDILDAEAIIKKILLKNWGIESLARPVLYGGSVNSENAAEFLSVPEVGGAVIGAASLKAEEFSRILETNPK